jgi:hypothetical protein
MSEWWKVGETKIVGATIPWNGTAPFARSAPLLMNGEGRIGAVEKYEGDNVLVDVDVDVVEPPEGLCSFDPVPVTKNAEVWLLRKNFHAREECLTEVFDSKCLLYGPITFPRDNVQWVIVHKDTDAEQLLKDWCERASEDAVELAATRKHEAHAAGLLTFTLCDSALNAGTYLATLDEKDRPDAYLALEERKGWHSLQAARMREQEALVRIYKRRSEWYHAAKSALEEEVMTLREQSRALLLQVRGGDSDPVTDTNHPGHPLLSLGWQYTGTPEDMDPYGCEWRDPQLQGGARITHALPGALGLALKRLMAKHPGT